MNSLSNNDFKDLFFETMKSLGAESTKMNTYKIFACANETNWNHMGINLTAIRIKAHNLYDCWLQLNKIFEEHSDHLYNREFVEDVGYEDCEEKELPHTMKNYVVAFINHFEENVTLWPVKL
jgi:hypothetical protein